MSIECGLPTVWGLLKWAVTAIKRPVEYAMSSKSFADGLRVEVLNLENEARRVNVLVQQARNNVRNFHDVFTAWEASVDEALEEARNLLDAFEKASKTCCYGTLPDPYCRYQFSVKAEAEIKVIQELAQKGDRFRELDDISFINPAPGNVAAPTLAGRESKDAVQSTTAMAAVFSASMSIKLRDAGVFESRALMIGSIMEALADNSNSVVGVYGMGGVGKSTLLEEVKMILSEEKSFDWVVKADVSENADIKRIQGEIADALGLTGIKDKETISGRAELLHRRLKEEIEKKKKVIIILDNLWKGLNLKLVGIPCEHDNKVIGCKLLLTSRDCNVLQSEMGCDKAFPLGGLKEDEAKKLFEGIVGDKFHDDEFKPWVEIALDKCAGVPFLIVAMAKRLKNAELCQWKDTLKKIKMSKDKKINDLINEMLQWSYDNLEEDEKSLLRLCAVYGISNPSLENLVRYGFGLGLFQEVGNMEEARDRLSSHILALQASSLLLDSKDVAGFKIHDLVSEFVVSVSSKDQPLLVLRDSVQELQKDKPDSYSAICFSYVDIEEVPQELDCPELQIFLLFTNNKSLRIPDSLFNSMRKLKILNLTGIRFTCFPSSFQFLENLRSLCLDNCSIYNLAILGGLKGLQILSFVNSDIFRLPKEIGLLTELRLLDLNNCSQLKVIEPGVLGSLTKLEELYMEDSFDEWNALDLAPATNASLIELNNMKNLCTLHVSIPDPKVIPEDLNVEKLTKYRIRIGNPRCWPSECKGSRSLELKFDPLNSVLHKTCIQSILCKTENLLLDKLDGNEQSICLLSQKGFIELKDLRVEYSPSIRCIFQSPSRRDFNTLESLLLKNLTNLEKLCHNHISSKSFSTLKLIRVESCNKMEVLFPLSVVRGLQQLEELEVVNCRLMYGIVKASDCGKVELRNLRVLKLRDLPDIKNFVNDESAPSNITSNDQMSTQIAFFNGQQVSIPFLETLTMEGLPILKEIWSDESTLELSNLQTFKVVRCESLSKVVSSKSLLKLQKLQTLTIEDCNSVQEIFYLDGPSNNENVEAISQLIALELDGMQSLRSIWNKNPCGIVSFQNLKKLMVDNCDNLGFLFFSSMIKSLMQLRDLTVSSCKKMKAIIMEEEGLGMEISETLAFSTLTNIYLRWLGSLTCFICRKNSQEAQSRDRIQSCSTALFNGEVAFPRLETLNINGLDNFGFIFPSSMVKSLAQLKKLEVSSCDNMTVIIMEEEGLRIGTSENMAFPMLTELGLSYLKSLKCFSSRKCSRKVPNEDSTKSDSIALFNREVTFPNLETLHIKSMDNIELIWDNQEAADSFHNLKSLVVDKCNKLVNLAPSCILGRLLSLESLEARHCGSLEIVFKVQPLNPPNGHPAAFFPLKRLKLFGLPKLMCIWDKELHHQFKFQSLCSIEVSRCESLTSLFLASATNYLIHLEKLKIEECGIVELIEKEDGPIPRFVFQKLTSLELKHLMKFKCIYNGMHASCWPALKTLEVHGCNKVEIFASQLDNEMTLDKQPLFLIEKGTFANLEELKLDLFEQMEIWNGHLQDEEYFRKLRVLKLCHLSKESPISTDVFVESLTNLEELVVSESYMKEPSNNEEAIEGTSHEQKVILTFVRCIRHLRTLEVSQCDGLTNIFTPTIAANLVALTKLRISNCRILTEVISDEEGEEERCVVSFKKLKYMELDGLIELRCFSSGGYTMMFPLLEDVIMNGCPNMKFFSKGPIEAPKLDRLQVDLKESHGPTKYHYIWKGDLNITIQNMFKEMATVAGARVMRLIDFPELVGKWHSDLNPIKSSWQLITLVVGKCPLFTSAIPSKLMLILEKMKNMQVCDCKSLEEIFDLEGLEAIESTRVLPQLRSLYFLNLPRLRRLWNKDLQGLMRFTHLYSLALYKCSNLRHALVPSMVRCLPNLRNLEIKECGQMEGVIVEEEGQGSTTEKITFPNLYRIQLECLPNLTGFLVGKNHTLDCPKVEYVTIIHCPKMRSLTQQTSMDIGHGIPSLFTPQVQFPQLDTLVLSHMNALSKIWIDDSQEALNFDDLESVTVQNCKSLEHLFPYWVATSLNQLKKLKVEHCEVEEIVTRGDDTPHSNTAQILFPKLTSLSLHDMPQLKSFCPNLATFNWSLLEELQVTHCDKVQMLSSVASINKWTQRNNQWDLSDQEAHSSFEKDFPNLERLLLVDKDIQTIQNGKLQDDIFGKCKALTLACFHDENVIFPTRFLLERFQNIESLEIFCSSFEVIFSDERLIDERRYPVLGNLRELKLNKLPNLKCMWREHKFVSKVFYSVKTFEVWDCPGLTTLFPAIASFQNLTKLVVKNSSGLIYLATVSEITNLVHLIRMTIIGCEGMKEIVKNDGNKERKVISLEKLERLTLENLSSLECFSSTTNCSFRFPRLGYITVEECPKMKFFSKGTLSMPELLYVRLFGHRWDWVWDRKSDLNTMIQRLSP